MITLTEYQNTEIDLTPADLAFVLDLTNNAASVPGEGKVFESILPTTTDDRYVVRSGPMVGRMALPSGTALDFVSRFPFADVMDIIAKSQGLPRRLDATPSDASGTTFLPDTIAIAFIREVERFLGQGLAKAYVKRTHTRPPYRGRYDPVQHLNRFAARPDRLVTVATHLTVDVDENRALLQALEILRRLPLRHDIGHRIARAAPAFGQVTPGRFTSGQIASIRLTSLTARYRQALALAALLVRGASIAPQGAAVAGSTVLFHMPTIWEAFVLRWVAEEWPTRQVTGGYKFVVSDAGHDATADVVVLDGHRVVALYDAKYKSLTDRPPTSDDLYQMITYCQRLQLGEATLVYPARIDPRQVRIGDRTITVLGLSQVMTPTVPAQ